MILNMILPHLPSCCDFSAFGHRLSPPSHSIAMQPPLQPYKKCSVQFSSVQFSSVAQSCPALCNPTDCQTPGFPVHHQLLEPTQTHVHQVGDAIQPTISSSVVPFSSCLQSFPASESFPRSQFFTSGGQSIGVSASVSVLPVNIQD